MSVVTDVEQSILTLPQGYRLALPSDDIDARRFERLLARGRELLVLGQPDRAAYVLGNESSGVTVDCA